MRVIWTLSCHGSVVVKARSIGWFDSVSPLMPGPLLKCLSLGAGCSNFWTSSKRCQTKKPKNNRCSLWQSGGARALLRADGPRPRLNAGVAGSKAGNIRAPPDCPLSENRWAVHWEKQLAASRSRPKAGVLTARQAGLFVCREPLTLCLTFPLIRLNRMQSPISADV